MEEHCPCPQKLPAGRPLPHAKQRRKCGEGCTGHSCRCHEDELETTQSAMKIQ